MIDQHRQQMIEGDETQAGEGARIGAGVGRRQRAPYDESPQFGGRRAFFSNDLRQLGERLLARDPSNSLARLATAVHEIELGQYAAARTQLASGDPRSRDVTAALLTAWCYAGQTDLHHALDSLDRIKVIDPERKKILNLLRKPPAH